MALLVDGDQQDVGTRTRELHAHDLRIAWNRYFADDVALRVQHADQTVVVYVWSCKRTLILEMRHVDVTLVVSGDRCRSKPAAHLAEDTNDL